MKSEVPASTREREAHVLRKAGFVSSILLAILTAVTFALAVLTRPVSGPFAGESAVTYPYAEIVSRFPRDYYWMFFAIALMLVFVVYVACIDQYANKLFSRVALIFACMSACVLAVNYFVQVSVIQPSLLNGEADGVAILTQYNPHGLFIAAEEIGYLLMSVSLLFLAPVFSGRERLQNAVRWTVVAGFMLTVLSFAAITIVYGMRREYLFEVAGIAIDFTELIVLGILSGVLFRRSAFGAQ